MIYKILMVYLILINLCSYLAMYIDKKRAKKNKYRIPERTLFMLVALGGGIGGIVGMNQFRHKTKHWYFKYGFPAIVISQIVLIIGIGILIY